MNATEMLRRPQVEARTGLSRAAIYAAMKRGEFPRPIRVGKRAVAWPAAEVDAWLSRRPRAANGRVIPNHPQERAAASTTATRAP